MLRPLFLLLFVGCAPASKPAIATDSPPHVSSATATVVPAESLGARVVVPGTGVSIVPPPELHLPALGTSFVDDSGKVMLMIGRGRRQTQAPEYEMFPGPPEHVTVAGRQGTLRTHERARDGGTFDGWSLDVVDGEAALHVMLLDGRAPSERWREFRRYLLTMQWSPREVDTELAFGATPGEIAGMTLDREEAGGLSYHSTGAEHATLTFVSTPVAFPKNPAGCAAAVEKTVRAGPHGSPRTFENEEFHGCDIDATDPKKGKADYRAVLGSDAGVIIVVGDAPAGDVKWRARFAAAVRALHRVH